MATNGTGGGVGGAGSSADPGSAAGAGELLRTWRQRSRRSQLDVALAAGISARHLSFLETGRARPSGAMIERLSGELQIPLRARNRLHLAAGLAPAHPERDVADLGSALHAMEAVLAAFDPHPALAVDAGWDLVSANRAAGALFSGLPADLMEPPANVLRLTFHPAGLAPRIRNFGQWRAHTLGRVARQYERTGDPRLQALYAELVRYPGAPGVDDARLPPNEVAVPLRLASEHGDLAFLYTATVFGAPRDVTLEEIAIEAFFPADEATAEAIRIAGRALV